MKKQTLTVLTAAMTMAVAGTASAAVVTNIVTRDVTSEEIGGGAPDGGTVIQFFLDSTADILSVNDVSFVLTEGAFYQDGLGADDEAPNPTFVAAFPALGVDSFINTPGGTSILPGFVTTTSEFSGTWGDLTDDGAQAGFLFAQFTTTADAVGTYSFDIAFAGAQGPEEQSFSGAIPIPEPSSLALISLGGLLIARRRRG
ncbi:MAG: PEP-CTERM sorting domain-containing protein [Planctomycetota bacterium]